MHSDTYEIEAMLVEFFLSGSLIFLAVTETKVYGEKKV